MATSEKKNADLEETPFAQTKWGLDSRLLKAVQLMGFVYPTVVQAKGVPLGISGKDLLVKARTGSGKTVMYILPLLQKILKEKELKHEAGIKALVLVPTKELCEQISEEFTKLTHYCQDVVSVVSLGSSTVKAQQIRLRSLPDVVVSTPSRFVQHLEDKTVELTEQFQTLVVDEADLVLSYGYREDIEKIVASLPQIVHTILLSATLSAELQSLKKVVLHAPVTLQLKEGSTDGELSEFYIKVPDDDKFLVLLALLKFNLLTGRCLIFVNDLDRCYKLKLFLDAFGLPAAVLNGALPANSRKHILLEFNKGIFDYLIATGEEEETSEFGVSRGIDFKGVSTVVNFDLPGSVKEYIHRVGRTARGGLDGAALSMVDAKSPDQVEILETLLSLQDEEAPVLQPLPLDVQEVSGLRYRVGDVLRKISRKRVKEARLLELKHELVNSEKLKTHFEDNPQDLQVLQHAAATKPAQFDRSLGTIPTYLVPEALRQAEESGKPRPKKRRRVTMRGGDPLRNLKSATAQRMSSVLLTLRETGESSSGRQAWKKKHRKGLWGKKNKKRKRAGNW